MQFSATLLSLLAATAFAAPISLESHVGAVTDMVSFGNTDIDTPAVVKRDDEHDQAWRAILENISCWPNDNC
ncbi:unnamed protein product [Ambrosiozyma monospora]|uniref:Unnamed protein product n=1 Tax=Ambrosiozyma monospora TaxID=43982 RepID=A0ACB5T640_AMBMO|nr:unnamed protein product [Ambrosiozyma monospora]